MGGRALRADHLIVTLGRSSRPRRSRGWPSPAHVRTLEGPPGCATRSSGLRARTHPRAHRRAGLQVPGRSLRGGHADRRMTSAARAPPRRSSSRSTRPSPGPMGVAGPEASRPPSRRWSSRRGSPTTRSTRSPASKSDRASSSPTALRRRPRSPGVRAADPAAGGARGLGARRRDGWVRVDRHTLADALPGRLRGRRRRPSFRSRWASLSRGPASSPTARPRSSPATSPEPWSRARPAERFDGHGACFVETGGGRAGFGAGDFYAEPRPAVRCAAPAGSGTPARCSSRNSAVAVAVTMSTEENR